MNFRKFSFVSIFVFVIFNSVFAQTTDAAYSLFSSGNEYLNNGDYSTALSYYKKAIPVYEKVYGKNHIYTADVYSLAGASYSYLRDFDNSIINYKKALSIYEIATETDSIDVATACSNIGLAYYEISDFDNAIIYHYKSLSIRQKRLGENNEKTADSYYNIALNYDLKADYTNALSFYQKALNIRKKILGENNAETANSYESVATVYDIQGKYENALNFFDKALKIRLALFGEDSVEVVDTYFNMAVIYQELQNYQTSLETNTKILEYYLSNFGKNNADTAKIYQNIGNDYYGLGNFSKALSNYKTSLEIYKTTIGEKNPDTANVYNNIGQVYQAMGDYANALANLETSVSILKSIYGEKHPDIARTYRNMGVTLRSQGKYADALSYFSKSVEMYKKFLGEKHIDVCRVYEMIGGVYENQKDYKNALLHYRKANNTLLEIFGYETLDVAKCYDDIARVYDIIGEHSDAQELYKAAVGIYTRELGEQHISTAIEYIMLGWHYAGESGNFNTKEAIACFRKAYSGLKESTNYLQVINSLSDIIRDSKQYHFTDDSDFIRETFELGAAIIEKARLGMSTMKSEILFKSLPFYYYGVQFEAEKDNPAKAFEYSESLRSRGFLGQIGTESALKLDGVTDSERKQIKTLVQKIENARKTLNEQNDLSINERDSKKASSASKELASAEKELSTLDSKIAKRLPQYGALRNPQPVKISEAQKFCGKKRSILEYVLFDSEEIDSEGKREIRTPTKYAYCIVVTKKKVQTIPLDSSFDYDSAVNALRDAITHRPIKSEVTFEKQRNKLYEKLVKPVLPYLGGIKDVLIVPDGNLSFLPFDMLRENSDSNDFGKNYSIGISPSVSVSILASKVKSKSSDILAFGGAWYDKSLSEEEHNQTLRGNGTRGKDRGLSLVTSQAKQTEQELRKLLENEGSEIYFENKNLNWQDLPGTVTELEALQKSAFKKAKVETQKSATEAMLKDYSKNGQLSKYSVLHFACHGYFDPDLSEMSSVLFSEVSGKLKTISEEDGYLTIGEAAILNLNANMVCLSACQTGLGEIKKGDGMVGLSRAFMVVGAKNVGVTLWCVDDEATAEFMTRMYKKVQSGMTYAEAYRKVKNEFRNSDEYNHPYYWAGFVVYE